MSACAWMVLGGCWITNMLPFDASNAFNPQQPQVATTSCHSVVLYHFPTFSFARAVVDSTAVGILATCALAAWGAACR